MITATHGDYITTDKGNALVCLEIAQGNKKYFYFDLKEMIYFPGKYTRDTGKLQVDIEWNALYAVTSGEIEELTNGKLAQVEFMLPFIIENPRAKLTYTEAKELEALKGKFTASEEPSTFSLTGVKGFDVLAGLFK